MLRHGLASPGNVFQMLTELRQADEQVKGRKAPENIEQIQFVEEWPEATSAYPQDRSMP